ncbi:MAG: serine hydrolase [Microscillaceae bacterium]|nr:serine hydrolase [Microscillaceae bacterium]
MPHHFFLGLYLFLFPIHCFAQPDENLLYRLMSSQRSQFASVLQNPDRYEVQIIYTQIFRDSLNKPHLQENSFRLNPNRYFNPASLVKLPVSVLALEKLGEILVPGVNKYARMGTDSAFACQKKIRANLPNDKKYPCLARYIEQMLLVSDNEAYSRVYEFLGQAYIEKKLHDKCFQSARIIRRFNNCDSSENRHTNPIRFYNADLQEIYYQAAQFNSKPFYPPFGKVGKGLAYIDDFGRSLKGPKDFTYSNFIALNHIHQMLVDIVFPGLKGEESAFRIGEGDRRFLLRALGSYPREGEWTDYQPQKGYYDTYKKYLYYGRVNQEVNPHLRIFNIVGWWEGYLSDCAYFVDFEKGIEFFLSAVIYVNKNQKFDYQFEYLSEGFPFLAHLGRLIYDYECTLIKDYKPNLSDLNFFK